MRKIRLILDMPHGGDWNMATDRWLLEGAVAGVAALRFYAWQRPTVTLGYFQPMAQRASHAPSQPCDLIRRSTGGGAIVHDQELTYSLALPQGWLPSSLTLYDVAHQTLCQTLHRFDVPAEICQVGSFRQTSQTFLCFQRHTPGDVLVGEHKVAGSAQRRQRGALLQQGSILLKQSPFAPELPGIRDVSPASELTADQLAAAWLSPLTDALDACGVREPLTAGEKHLVDQIRSSRYGNPLWTRRR